MSEVIWFISSLLVIQQFFYMWQIAKLTDKLMSRSFTEYQQALKPPQRIQIPVEQGPMEDLNVLGEFRIA